MIVFQESIKLIVVVFELSWDITHNHKLLFVEIKVFSPKQKFFHFHFTKRKQRYIFDASSAFNNYSLGIAEILDWIL